MSPLQAYGQYGEDWLACSLIEQGFHVGVPVNRFQKGYDLMAVDGYGVAYPLHIKVARYANRKNHGRWRYMCQFRFSNVVDDGGFVAAGASYGGYFHWFLFPTSELSKHQYLYLFSPPDAYKGWARKYLVGVDGFRSLLSSCPKVKAESGGGGRHGL